MPGMKAMVLEAPGKPLCLREVPCPVSGFGEVLLRVAACGVCRTDLHVIDGELPKPKLPLIPGHQVVGEVVATGNNVETIAGGQRVGAHLHVPRGVIAENPQVLPELDQHVVYHEFNSRPASLAV